MNNFRIRWSLSTLFLFVVNLLANARVGIAEECGGRLLVVEETAVSKYDADLQIQEVVIESPFPFGVEYDPETDTVFWSDLNTREIKAVKDRNSEPILYNLQQGNWMPYSLAVDSVNQKLYVVESFTSTIHLIDLVQGNHGIILGTNITEAKKVAVDPYEGYLFVLDKYEVFRTDLDGENRQVILTDEDTVRDLPNTLPADVDADNLSQETVNKPMTVSDIIVDTNAKRIYWVDTLFRRIESSDYNGQDKKVHFHNESELVSFESLGSLALLDGEIYWADGLDKKVIKVDLNQENKIQEISKYLLAIKPITCKSERKIETPCNQNNGGCQQLCVSSKSTETKFRCACNIGYKLNIDNKTCLPVHDFLLFSAGGYLRGQVLNGNGSSFTDVLNPTNFEVGNGASFDIDVENNLVFYSSLYPKDKLHQVSLETGKQTPLHPDLLSNSTGKVAYDWITKNLYYFTYYYSDMTTLSVTNIDDPTYSKILVNNVPDLVRDLVIHPNMGYLYYAQKNDDHGFISRVAVDGSDLTILLRVESKSFVDSLALDDVEGKLYWSESKQEENNKWSVKIRYSNLLGEDVKDLALPYAMDRISSMSMDEDWLYVVTGPNTAVVRLSKVEPVQSTTLFQVQSDISVSGVKVFARNSQWESPENPCVPGNDCEKFCFAVPNVPGNGHVERWCSCPYGERRGDDNKSCVDNSEEEPPFLPCESTAFKCTKRTKGQAAFAG